MLAEQAEVTRTPLLSVVLDACVRPLRLNDGGWTNTIRATRSLAGQEMLAQSAGLQPGSSAPCGLLCRMEQRLWSFSTSLKSRVREKRKHGINRLHNLGLEP